MNNYENAHGPLDLPLVNDYLFRALLQRNNNVLKSLVASLLHMEKSEITSIKIENEIVLGHSKDDKEFILDIRILLNNSTVLNLEMQVVNQHNWVERSMSYLSRTFDNLARGEDYKNVKAAIQIGLLDYSLFPESPEFYSSYYLINEKSHHKYSDKLRISVLDLTRIDLATDEDKLYHIDHWASLFKSKTWEELKMLAQNDEVLNDAVSTIYEINQDPLLHEEIRAREERLAHERYVEEQLSANAKQLAENEKLLAERQQQLTESEKQLAESEKQLAENEKELHRLRKLLQENGIDVE